MPQFGDHPVLILPPARMQELMQKSDAEVDSHVIHNEQVQATYTIGDDISIDISHFNVVRRQLTRKLPLLTGSVYGELALAFDDQWGATQEWTELKVYPTCMKIVARAANRVFAGVELCR